MTRFTLSLLGSFQVTLDGERVTAFGSDTARALLAYLAMHADSRTSAGVAHSRDALAGLLWPEQPNTEALRNLRVALSRLRAAIGDQKAEVPLLQVERRSLGLSEDADWSLDVGMMREALAATRSHEHAQLEGCDECAERLQEVAELYRGELLTGFALDSVPFEEWMVVERESLHWQALEALSALASYHERRGHEHYEAAIEYARRQVELEPWREGAHRQWMRALALSGHRGAALAQYDACRRVLAEELGVEPEAETTALYVEIREGKLAPARQVEAAPTVAPEPPQVVPAPVRVEDERRTVTVVEATVGGAAELLSRLGSEEWATTMGRLLRALGGEVHRYGGDIDRYDETGLVACFGAMWAHEDDPERAVLAALSMRDAFVAQVNDLSARERDEGDVGCLGLRVSVHTGEVIVTTLAGGGGRSQGKAMGEAVVYAAEMHAQTKPGQVRVSESTYRRVAPLFEWQVGEKTGERESIQGVLTYCPTSHKDLASKGRGLEGLTSPLVGRDGEFLALLQTVERLQSGIGGIVTVVGEAGIGKSRLVTEFKRSPALRSANLEWEEGRCLSYGEGVAYQLWLDLLRGLLDVAPDASPAVVRDTLRAWVHGLCSDSLDEVLPYLGRLLSLPLDEGTEARLCGLPAKGIKANTFRAIETLLECAARRQPLVIVCEDLHWADPTSLELLEHLFPMTDRVPLLFVCVLRPQTEHGCWRIRETVAREYRHRHIDLWLEALSAAESAELVGNLLRIEDLPRDLRERVLAHGEGNPFYVEEILRSLINSGVIVYDEVGDRWHATQDVREIAIPDTLQGVLVARIDRLPADARRLLQLASVIGRIFSYRVLAAIAEKSGLDDHLVTLQRAQMIRERARLPEVEYAFKHVLTQVAAYEGLLVRARRALHRRVAEAWERLYPERIEEQLGLLAHHWEQAGDASRAVSYLRRAGEQVAGQYANAEAIEYLSRALELAPEDDLAGRYALLLVREGVLDVYGAREAQDQVLTAMETLARDGQDPGRQAESAVRRAHYAIMIMDYPTAIAAAQAGVRFAQAAQDKQSEATAFRHWGRALRRTGEFDAAQPHFERALDIARAASLRQEEGYCLRQLGLVRESHGDDRGAIAYHEQALRLFRQIGDRRGEGLSLRDIGMVLLGQNALVESQPYLEQSLCVCRETGDRRNEGWAAFNLGHVHRYQGDLFRAMNLYEHARPLVFETGEPGWAADILARSSVIYLQLGDYAKARDCMEQSLHVADPTIHPDDGAALMIAVAYYAHYTGDDQLAWDYYRQSLRVLEDLDNRLPLALVLIGHFLAKMGRLTEAADAYQQAAAVPNRTQLVDWETERHAGLVRLCLAQGDAAGALTHAKAILPNLVAYPTLPTTSEPFLIYLSCYRALRANDDPRAGKVLSAAYRLLHEWAGRIEDEEWRRSFLENVAAHRDIVVEYEREHASPSSKGQ